jgi:enterochelin esterase-like enzyme
MRTLAPLLFAVAVLASVSSPAMAAKRKAVHLVRIAAPTLEDPSRSVRVYLPPSYDREDARDRRYPVVYLLHGWPGSDDNWPHQGRAAATLDSLSVRGEIPELIAIMPNGHGVGMLGRSLWLNSFDGRSRMEDFVAGDLVNWVDSTYRTIPDAGHRAVVGLSDGGTGAFNLLMQHRDRFSAAASLSGRFWLEKEVGMTATLIGRGDSAVAFLEANSPGARLAREKDTFEGARLYVDCGLSDHDLSDNRQFHAELVKLGVPHEYHEFPGGHGWKYWRVHLRDALLSVVGIRPEEKAVEP